ncbi:hypothetical protein MMC10_009757 [Thelotrema lepadinum]|nr:hypothetical protein [Thelotrema lepadinum]
MAIKLVTALATLALFTTSHGAPVESRTVQPSIPNGHWVDTWTAMPQLTEYTNLPPPPFNTSGTDFVNSTIRQTLHMSLGSEQIRIRMSNAFGVGDLTITAATVALPSNGSSGDPAISSTTLQKLTFSGNDSITLPNGALGVSDPLNFVIKPQSEITVTIYLENGQPSNNVTSHPGSRATSYVSFGDYTSATNMTDSSTVALAHWYYLTAVEAWVPASSRAFAIVGDSITDGRGSTTDGNNRWPDLVLQKMQNNSSTANIAVVNQAAGGNRVLEDGLGPTALGRIDRDVLAQSGVKYAMIFEGVNDIGDAATTTEAQQQIGDALIEAFKQIRTRVHAFGIPIFTATITPFLAPSNTTIQPYSDATQEVTRQRVNDWIKTSGNFDAVVDFASIVADPKNQSMLNPLYNSGDYLHPNVAGYQAIANAFPLSIFQKFAGGVSSFT